MSHDLNISRLRNALNLKPSAILPLVSIQLGWDRRLANVRVCFGRRRTGSLYYNGIVFVRVMLPFFVGVMVRWSGSSTERAYLQAHIGWKLNGVFAATFRIQSDAAAAAGHQSPNTGQAVGWADGPK